MAAHVFDHEASRQRPPSTLRVVAAFGALAVAIVFLGSLLLRSDVQATDLDPAAAAQARALLRAAPADRSQHGAALLEAARTGDGELVVALIDSGVDPDFRDAQGWSALSWAVQNGETSIARRLLVAGARLGEAERTCGSDLHLAAQRDDPLLVGILLDAGAKIDAPAQAFEGATALHLACEAGNLRSVARLVRAQADLDARDERGFTPLARAVLLGHVSLVEFLIARGADLRLTDARGRTVLHLGAASGSAPCVRTLLDAGLDPAADDGKQWTPLHYAAAHGHRKLIDLLAHAGKPECLAARTSRGMTALHLAARLGDAACVTKLLDAGLDPLVADSSGRLARELAPADVRGNPWDRLGPSPAAEGPRPPSQALLDASPRRPRMCLCTRPARILRGPMVLLDLAIWDDGATIFAPWDAEGSRLYEAGVMAPAAVEALLLDLEETSWLDAELPPVDSGRQECVELHVERNGDLTRTSWDEVGRDVGSAHSGNRAASADCELAWMRVRQVLRSARPSSTSELSHVLVDGAFRGLTFGDGAHADWLE